MRGKGEVEGGELIELRCEWKWHTYNTDSRISRTRIARNAPHHSGRGGRTCHLSIQGQFQVLNPILIFRAQIIFLFKMKMVSACTLLLLLTTGGAFGFGKRLRRSRNGIIGGCRVLSFRIRMMLSSKNLHFLMLYLTIHVFVCHGHTGQLLTAGEDTVTDRASYCGTCASDPQCFCASGEWNNLSIL